MNKKTKKDSIIFLLRFWYQVIVYFFIYLHVGLYNDTTNEEPIFMAL